MHSQKLNLIGIKDFLTSLHPPDPIDHVAHLMYNRIWMGNFRFEGDFQQIHDPDQVEHIGPNWRTDYVFNKRKPEAFIKRFEEKWIAYWRSGNQEFLIDALNYLWFDWLQGDYQTSAEILSRIVLREFLNPLRSGTSWVCADQGINGP